MNRKLIAIFVIVMFAATLVSGCSLMDPQKLGGMKLGKYGETLNVKKDDLDNKIKTQWGSFSFKSKEIKKIKKLKNITTVKGTKAKAKATYNTTKTTSKGKKITVTVSYVGSKSYQILCAKIPGL